MTTYINKLKDKTGNQRLPVTHERAVRDDKGTTLESKLQNLEGAMDKAYVAQSDNGMGRITLKKNIVSGVNTLTQSMMQATNTIYIIRYDFTLGEDITVPANCVLEFDGGSLNGNNTITLQNTYLEGNVKILCDFVGTITNQELNVLWFGIVQNSNVSQQERLQKVINLYANNVPSNPWDVRVQNAEPKIIIPHGTYIFGNITLRSYLGIYGEGRTNTILKNTYFSTTSAIYNAAFKDFSLIGSDTPDSDHTDSVLETDKCAFKVIGARLVFENIVVHNYDVAFSFYNTYLTDIKDTFVNYCSICMCINGASGGSAGSVFNLYGGELAGSTYGLVNKGAVGAIHILNTAFEQNTHAVKNGGELHIYSGYFEGNTSCIEGTILNGYITECKFSSNTGYILLDNAYHSTISYNIFPNTQTVMISISGTVSAVECYKNDAIGSHVVRTTSNITNVIGYDFGKTLITVSDFEVTPAAHAALGYFTSFALPKGFGPIINMMILGDSDLYANNNIRIWHIIPETGNNYVGYLTADKAGTYKVRVVYGSPTR